MIQSNATAGTSATQKTLIKPTTPT